MTEDLRGGRCECERQLQCCQARVGALHRKMGAPKASGGLRIGRSLTFRARFAFNASDPAILFVETIPSRLADRRISGSPRSVPAFDAAESKLFDSVPPISPSPGVSFASSVLTTPSLDEETSLHLAFSRKPVSESRKASRASFSRDLRPS